MTHQEQDAFGLALLDHLEGSPPRHLTLQSDDGVSTEAMPPSWFFQTEASWVDWERSALEQAEGPVLDLGAGAGRASLFLQARGRAVTAVDRSPGAVEVCRRRGVSDVRLCDFVSDLPNDKRWRTILLLCGNLGLAGSWDASRDLLVRLHDVCAEGAVILADTVDPTVGADARTTAYQQRMLSQGEYIGKVTLRLVYGETVGAWWSQVNILIPDVPRLIAGTGWALEDHLISGMDHYLRLRRE